MIKKANDKRWLKKIFCISRLQPIRSNVNSVGAPEKNHTYLHGLLGILSRNETIAIPKVETYSPRLVATDFTIPLWMNRYKRNVRLALFNYKSYKN